MVSSPVQNLSDFFRNKPPLVVFLLCLVVLAVSTFYFAFRIESDEIAVDIAKKHDWIEMLKHFNKLDICINSSSWNDKNEEKFKEIISVYTKISIDDISKLQAPLGIYGILSLEGWYPTTCQDLENQPKNVAIYFNVPPVTKPSNGSIDICATIKGPAQFLPYIEKPSCTPRGKANGVTRFLSSKLLRNSDPKFCEKGDIVELKFDSSVSRIDNKISDDVRTRIYIHLLWCSYFLVFVIFAILLFFILKKSAYLEKKEQSARLL